MSKVKVKLLRPVDGRKIGAVVQFNKADAERLVARGAAVMVAAKAAPAPSNKMAEPPANKGQDQA